MFLKELTQIVASWDDCVLFAECIDKSAFGEQPPETAPFEEAFGHIVTRFHAYLEHSDVFGMLVQDQNDTVSRRLTDLMRRFHSLGTPWTTEIPLLIETPLFVDSRLTSMVQVADVCAYATRRYFENGEVELFDIIYPKFRRLEGRCVGARHSRGAKHCACRMCVEL